MTRSFVGWLFFCFITLLVGTYVSLKLHEKQVRKEVKLKMISGLDKHELVLLKFTEKETQTNLLWKHSKEFEYNGQMYDVVESLIQGDSIFYWCWWDCIETKLSQQLNDLVDIALGNSEQQKHHQKQPTAFCKSLYCENFQSLMCFMPSRKKGLAKPSDLTYQRSLFPPEVPPPEVG